MVWTVRDNQKTVMLNRWTTGCKTTLCHCNAAQQLELVSVIAWSNILWQPACVPAKWPFKNIDFYRDGRSIHSSCAAAMLVLSLEDILCLTAAVAGNSPHFSSGRGPALHTVITLALSHDKRHVTMSKQKNRQHGVLIRCPTQQFLN